MFRKSSSFVRTHCHNCFIPLMSAYHEREESCYCRICYATWYVPNKQTQFKSTVLKTNTVDTDLLNFARFGLDESFNDTIKISTNEDSFSGYMCQVRIDDKHCGFTGTRSKFIKHLSDAHSNVLFLPPNSPCIWRKTDAEYQANVIFEEQEIFILHRQLVTHDNFRKSMYWALQHIGRPLLAENYIYDIEINYRGRKIKFVDECHPNEDDFDAIASAGICITVPMATLRPFIDANGLMLYTVELKYM